MWLIVDDLAEKIIVILFSKSYFYISRETKHIHHPTEQSFNIITHTKK